MTKMIQLDAVTEKKKKKGIITEKEFLNISKQLIEEKLRG